jgi:hypothetical protein
MRNVVITIAACTLIASAGNTQWNSLSKGLASMSRGLSHSSSNAGESALKSMSKKGGSIIESGANKAIGEAGVVGEAAGNSLIKKSKMPRTSFESNLSLSKNKKFDDIKEEFKDQVKDYFEDKLLDEVEGLIESLMDGIDSDDSSSSAPLVVRQPSGSLLIYAGSFSIQAQASGQRLKNSRCSSCGAFRYGPYRYGYQKKCGHSWF